MENATALRLTAHFDETSCCVCGVIVWLPHALYRNARESPDHWWYCPNGHRQHFTESENSRLQKALEAEQATVARLREERDRLERSRQATRGAMKRLKRRIENGVCPACRRTFQDLQRHMAGQHKGWADVEIIGAKEP